ncbi:unnamed protein product [Victoria cruziana]
MACFRRFLEVFKTVGLGMATCLVALVGAVIGMIMGAMAGQTKETGFFRGAGIGAFGGVVLSMDVLESVVHGQTFHLEAVLVSMANGKVFREWVIPAIVGAYQQQVLAGDESTFEVAFDIFSSGVPRGLLLESIQKLQLLDISYEPNNEACGHQASCAICLQDFEDGDAVRRLPQCRHIYHGACVDRWLSRRGSCPMCRKEIVI